MVPYCLCWRASRSWRKIGVAYPTIHHQYIAKMIVVPPALEAMLRKDGPCTLWNAWRHAFGMCESGSLGGMLCNGTRLPQRHYWQRLSRPKGQRSDD